MLTFLGGVDEKGGERASQHTQTHEHTQRYYLFRQPLLSQDLERTLMVGAQLL